MKYSILSRINGPDDVKKIPESELNNLCAEIRDCLINTVSSNGGHLASNLGVVELSVALHRVFNSPTDTILFDVGHQSYTHKLLTGRFNNISTIRCEYGISGFMRPNESEHDPFVTGHSSNSVSASLGISKARSLLGENGYTVTVLGDGAMSGGMVYEAINNAGIAKNKFIVILNDNKMSISKNVGGLARYLTYVRSKASYHRFKGRVKHFLKSIPIIGAPIARKILNSKAMLKNAIYGSDIFESFGFNYLGPVNGHNIAELENIFNIAKNENRPVLIHVLTQKGKGYTFAEEHPTDYHGVAPFDSEVGINEGGNNFSTVFGNMLCKMAEADNKVCAITAAMASGTGLQEFAKKFKNRFFDVGIAEEHAATFAAGLGIRGIKPYFAVYSSFLQRAYDQLIHDIAIENIPVRICVDRAGIVGEDGESHQGLFDVAFLSTIPNMHIYSPASNKQLEYVLNESLNFDFPSAIRYPRGSENLCEYFTETTADYSVFGTGNIAMVTYGRIVNNALIAAKELEKNGINCSVISLLKIHPLPNGIVDELKKYNKIYFFEEGIRTGGIAEQLSAVLIENGITAKIRIFAVENQFVLPQKTESALKKFNLDADSMFEIIKGDI